MRGVPAGRAPQFLLKSGFPRNQLTGRGGAWAGRGGARVGGGVVDPRLSQVCPSPVRCHRSQSKFIHSQF